jgi:hypothetical protein
VANYIKNLFAVFRMPKGCALCAMMAGILTILHLQAKPKERRTGTVDDGLKENENLRVICKAACA